MDLLVEFNMAADNEVTMAADNEQVFPAEAEPVGGEVEHHHNNPENHPGSNLDRTETQFLESRTTKEDIGEIDSQATPTQTTQRESDDPVRGGPTGPRTKRGKQRSSRNGIKFGIFSKATLLKDESPKELQSLREALWKSMPPGDSFEEIMLDKIASVFWRLRRTLVAESAEVSINSNFVEIDQRRAEQVQAQNIYRRRQQEAAFGLSNEDPGLIWDISNPDVLDRCSELLVELRQRIEIMGLNWDMDSAMLQTVYGNTCTRHRRKTLYDSYQFYFKIAKVPECERQSKDFDTPEECKQDLLQAIDREILSLTKHKQNRESIEFKRRKVMILRQCVPNSSGMDLLLRYRTSLERELDRALTQYERAQRIRKGQPVMPPVKIDISSFLL